MIITVDSNILLSIFTKDGLYERSAALLQKHSAHEYVINDCIYLELGVFFSHHKQLDDALTLLEVRVEHPQRSDCQVIAAAWKKYLSKKSFTCPSCKKTIQPVCHACGSALSFRQRVLADFLIGGFAFSHTDAIMTHDTSYYKNYFPRLKVICD